MAVDIAAPKQRNKNFDFQALFRQQSQTELDLLRQKMSERSSATLNTPTPEQTPTPTQQSEMSPLERSYGVTQEYGNYNPQLYSGRTAGSKHYGLDVGTPIGTEIKSPFSGIVGVGKSKDFGNYVEIKATDGRIMRFSHLQNIDDLVRRLGETGQAIQSGQMLGTTGNTGYTTGPHLDIMYQVGGKWVDPRDFEPLRKALR